MVVRVCRFGFGFINESGNRVSLIRRDAAKNGISSGVL